MEGMPEKYLSQEERLKYQMVPETGLSQDYLNEFAHFLLVFGYSENPMKEIREIALDVPIQTYTERFSGKDPKFLELSGDEQVKKLDCFVEGVREEIQQGVTKERFFEIYNELQKLIRGEGAVTLNPDNYVPSQK